ncbi:MAG: AMP-binding protein, partial [Oscillospiraceae bacterium]|nr:AMP-binding protein [Oscillospiraceae bacterium]
MKYCSSRFRKRSDIMQQMNVLEYLERTAPRVPQKLAFSDGTEGLTFAEVFDQSRAVGSRLAKDGYYNEPVVVFMRKHPKCVPAFFGCVYGGCYYVPIDEEMPRFRIELIFQNLKPRVMICDDDTVEMAKTFDFDGQILIYDQVAQEPIEEAMLASIRARQLDTDPIYIVFTSGSTGVPKGVVACHRSVIDYIENLSDTLGFGEHTVFANQAPLYFDACLKELYPTIKFGATTYIVPHSLFMFPIKLVEYLNEHKVNTVCWVVSALTMISSFKTFEKVKPQYLDTIAFGSEVFPIKQFRLWRQALPEARFTNLYGPTECTGMSCFYHVDRDFELDEAIPVGRPFKNTQILLLTDK